MKSLGAAAVDDANGIEMHRKTMEQCRRGKRMCICFSLFSRFYVVLLFFFWLLRTAALHEITSDATFKKNRLREIRDTLDA